MAEDLDQKADVGYRHIKFYDLQKEFLNLFGFKTKRKLCSTSPSDKNMEERRGVVADPVKYLRKHLTKSGYLVNHVNITGGCGFCTEYDNGRVLFNNSFWIYGGGYVVVLNEEISDYLDLSSTEGRLRVVKIVGDNSNIESVIQQLKKGMVDEYNKQNS